MIDDDDTARRRTDLLGRPLDGRGDGDHGAGATNAQLLDPAKQVDDRGAAAEFPVRDLQRQARMHVVHVRNAEHGASQPRQQRALLVRIQHIVAPQAQPHDQIQKQQAIEPDLQPRRAGRNRAREMRPIRAKHAGPQFRRLLTDRVGQNVDLMPTGNQLPGAVVSTQRRAA